MNLKRVVAAITERVGMHVRPGDARKLAKGLIGVDLRVVAASDGRLLREERLHLRDGDTITVTMYEESL